VVRGSGGAPHGGLLTEEKLSVLWALTGKTATPRASPLIGRACRVGHLKAERALVGMVCARRVSGSAAGHRRSVTGATPGGLPPFKHRQSTQLPAPGEKTMNAMCGGRSRPRRTRLRAKSSGPSGVTKRCNEPADTPTLGRGDHHRAWTRQRSGGRKVDGSREAEPS
jgi:hypothetical protein